MFTLDRSVVIKRRQGEPDSDLEVWRSRTPQERLAAVEFLRQQYIRWKYGAEPRLQRIYRVVKRTRD